MFFVATLSLFGFEKSIESEGTGGAYFHSSSDGMMQTLPSVQLKEAPLFSLFYLHVQPPLLDQDVLDIYSSEFPVDLVLEVRDGFAVEYNITTSTTFVIK